MNNTQHLPSAPARGITRACAGIVESVITLPYTEYVAQASLCIGNSFGADNQAENERRKLVEAIKLNLIDRKEYPFSLLQRRYGLPLGIRAFLAEKRRFIHTLATLCGFLPKPDVN